MWAFGYASNVAPLFANASKSEFQKETTKTSLSHFQTFDVEESEFFIIESEPEFEVELDWFPISTKSFNSLKSSLKENTNSYITSLFSSKETIPLYDLYCNWKFHLS